MRETQKIKLLRIWAARQVLDPKRFFVGYEFTGQGADFIGYKAPTRFSELCVENRTMIESKMQGKYRVGRIRFELLDQMFPDIPREYETILRAAKEACTK